MKLLSKTLVLSGLIICMPGCFSYMALEHSKSQIRERRFIEARNVNDVPSVGFNVSNFDAFKENKWLQIFAALLDTGLAIGGYEIVQKLDEKDNEPKKEQQPVINIVVQDSDDIDIRVINGNENVSNQDHETNN